MMLKTKKVELESQVQKYEKKIQTFPREVPSAEEYLEKNRELEMEIFKIAMKTRVREDVHRKLFMDLENDLIDIEECNTIN